MITKEVLESLIPPSTSLLVRNGRVIKRPYSITRGSEKDAFPIYISYGLGGGHQTIFDADVIEHVVSEEEIREALLAKLMTTRAKLEQEVKKLSNLLGDK